MDDDDDTLVSSPFSLTTKASPRSRPTSLVRAKPNALLLALVQNKVSQLARMSIKSLSITTLSEFGYQNEEDEDEEVNNGESLSFTQFLQYYLLTKETVPNLQSLRITYAGGAGQYPALFSKAVTNCLPAPPPPTPLLLSPTLSNTENNHIHGHLQYFNNIAAILSNFLESQPAVRLTWVSPILFPLHAIVRQSTIVQHALRHLQVDVLQSPSEHQALHSLLCQLPNLEYLSVSTREHISLFNDDEDEDDDDEEVLYQVDKTLFKFAFHSMKALKTLIIKSTSLVEAFTPEAIPPSVSHLELEANYNNSLLVPAHPSQFSNLWTCLISSPNLMTQLTTLNIGLWTSDLFPCPVSQRFFNPTVQNLNSNNNTTNNNKPNNYIKPYTGNLRSLTIEGDYMPPGLDTLLFTANPKLKQVKIPVIYAQGAHALAQYCSDTLEDLTVSGLKGGAVHHSAAPDFLEYRLLPLLARCHKLQSLYIHVSAKTLHGFDVLHLLKPSQNHHQQQQLGRSLLPPPSPLLNITIEQTDYDLPHYKELISAEEYDEFGGFSMLPLDCIKQRLELYTAIRTTFAPVEGDLSGIQQCLIPAEIDVGSSSGSGYGEGRGPYQEDEKGYSKFLPPPYVRYNCVFKLDVERFLQRNAFLFG